MQAPRRDTAEADLYVCAVARIDPGAAPSVAVPACPVCDATAARPRFSVDAIDAQVVVCEGCGLGRVHPQPSPAEIASFYPPAYYGDLGSKFRAPIELLVRAVGARHVRFLAQGLPHGARVLDVGCGRGVLLSALADRGFEAHGVEISAAAVQGADPRARIRIADDVADAAFPAAYFDCAIVWHVLEHVHDPRASLAAIHRALRPGGRLVLAVPNFASLQARWAGAAWFHLDPPRHLYHFSLPQNPFGWVQSWLNQDPELPRNGLYTLLYERAGRELRFDPRTRARLLVGLVLAAPPALALSVIEALLRSGGTVHVVCRRR